MRHLERWRLGLFILFAACGGDEREVEAPVLRHGSGNFSFYKPDLEPAPWQRQRRASPVTALDGRIASDDPLCGQVCAAIAALPCATTAREQCERNCAAAHAERCGEPIRALQSCLLEQDDGWMCLAGVTIRRERCPAPASAVECCLTGCPTLNETNPLPDGGTRDGASVQPEPNPDEGGLADDAGQQTPESPVVQPPAASPSCTTMCMKMRAIECPNRSSQADCLAMCSADESGACGAEGRARHECLNNTADAWICLDQTAVAVAPDACSNETVGWALCLAAL